MFANGNVQLYVFARGTPRKRGNKRHHTGMEFRLRRGPHWYALSATATRPVMSRGRGKFWAELALRKTDMKGRRVPDYLKRYVRVVVGRGGDHRRLQDRRRRTTV